MLNDSNLNNPIISFTHVSKTYEQDPEPALNDATFDISHGEFVCIIGPSGCGKSTVLKLIAGIEEPTSGTVVRPNNIAMVFQTGALLPWLNVYDNVAFGLRAKGLNDATIHKDVIPLLDLMKLGAFRDKYPSQLSGGQRQRVGIARALAVNPDLLLLDEPFSALDPKILSELHHDLVTIWKDTKKTIVMVSHQIEEAVSLSGKIILMKNRVVSKTYSIDLPYPRREHADDFSRHVSDIRRDFFA